MEINPDNGQKRKPTKSDDNWNVNWKLFKTCGKTIAEAFMRMYFLQRACESQIMAMAGSGELTPLDQQVIDHVHRQTELVRNLITDLSWAAVLDRVIRVAPDYKD